MCVCVNTVILDFSDYIFRKKVMVEYMFKVLKYT